MSAEINPSPTHLDWLEQPDHPVCRPGTDLLSWLTYRGVLTIRMKEQSPHPFRLQLLEPLAGPGQMLETESIRRVILWSGDTPCIYAESYLPKTALMALPDLRKLGGDPLGEMLNSHPEISREKLEFALLSSPRLPNPIETEASKPLWARRARYKVNDTGLIVAELFLPGIETLGQKPVQV